MAKRVALFDRIAHDQRRAMGNFVLIILLSCWLDSFEFALWMTSLCGGSRLPPGRLTVATNCDLWCRQVWSSRKQTTVPTSEMVEFLCFAGC